ncbi:YjzC family protein [Ornithinibacillus salinisoli]|uniref:YjzC family protein n=1 Tax=Ornithinibacillus salinisoli TaxID=1848459 RepID=A0ABW4W5X7_9BACI
MQETREYRTGQGVPATGHYLCQSGKTVKISKGEKFPSCPVSSKETTWTHDQQ